MIQPRGAEIDVEILMQRIREGVAKHRLARFNASLNVGDSQLPVPPRSAAGVNTAVAQPRVVATPSAIRLQLPEPCRIDLQPAFQPSTTGQYHVNDLLVFHNEAFITAAYRALLRRAPDEPGFKYYLGRLRDGISKIQILGQIRYSPEGKSAGVVVSGLLVSYTLRKIYSWPILGRLAQTVAALWNFPNFERNQQKFENLIVQFIEKAGEHYQEYIDVLYRAAHDLEAGHSRLLAYQVETNAALRAAVDGLIQTVQSLAQTKSFLQAALDGVN
ncbi:MAG TPA: DUF4214 domain-containing protein [Burkholderiales bacterium]|nr:DUF4214 domain-containing protein [Burkholderiales bacterium]